MLMWYAVNRNVTLSHNRSDSPGTRHDSVGYDPMLRGFQIRNTIDDQARGPYSRNICTH